MEQQTQNTNWPSESGLYKVIQLDGLEGEPILSFGRNEMDGLGDYHTNILEGFASKNNIKCEERYDPEGREVKFLPENCGYRVVGAGKCKFSLENKTASFYGESFSYNLEIDQKHLSRLKERFPDMAIK